MIELKRSVIALDVGGTKIACGVFLENGQTLFHCLTPTIQESASASIAQLISLVTNALSAVPSDAQLVAVGIAIPGWVHHRQGTVWAPNIAGWDHLALAAQLQGQLPATLVLEADRSAYVAGEAWLGAARGLRDVIFLAVGTGIGAGIMSDGHIIHGHDDLAGAVGWMALNPQFEELYARMGCFEAEASGSSVGRKAAARLTGSGPQDEWTALEVVQMGEQGDPEARALLDEAGVYLGMGVANLVSTLNPEMIVLGGGLFQSGDYLLERVRREFPRWAQPFAAERVRLERSALGGNAGLIGAARLAFNAAAA